MFLEIERKLALWVRALGSSWFAFACFSLSLFLVLEGLGFDGSMVWV